MAENSDGQEKTEEPTPKKKQDSRDKGKVITSKEMFVLASMLGAIVILMAGNTMGYQMASTWSSFFRFDTAENLDGMIADRLEQAVGIVFIIGLVIGVPLLIVTLGMQAAMGGLIFASENFKPKWEKINILKGIKRMVSMKALVELGKALLKLVLLTIPAGIVIWQWLPQLAATAFMSVGDMMTTMSGATFQVLVALVIALAIIGAVDLVYQIYSMNKNLKMTKQEVKDEHKQTEGSPEIKGQIRRRQMEAAGKGAERRAALDNVGDATAIITNPKHFSVALRYNPGEDEVPVVIALGEGAMAFQIREKATEHDVRILPVPPLARALYFTSNIGGEIHPSLYAAVATILAHVYHLDQDEYAEQPDVDVPADFQFNEFGMVSA